MGEVLRVFDRERGCELALKRYQPPRDDSDARFLFRQEFWSLQALAHPHLVQAFDYATDAAGMPFFTLELVEGADLAAPARLTETAVRTWLPMLLAALAYLHGRGMLHGDLKPENVRVDPTGRLVLMDLGLHRRIGSAGGPIRGSLAYMAPEAIRQGSVDARTDLYALGALLYHVLEGHPPFQQQTPLALLRAQLDEQPRALRAEGTTLAMTNAVARLLAKDPAGRFASVSELCAALGIASDATDTAMLYGAPIVGVTAARLAAVATATGGGSARIRCLVGGTGAGKTRLLNLARAEAQLAGRTVLAARGLGPDALPYQALAPWLEAIAAQPQAAPFERLAPYIAGLVPRLGLTPAQPLDAAQERARAQAALVELAGCLPAPVTWILDDADWLDPASAALVAALARPEAAGWHWLLAAGGPEHLPLAAELVAIAPLEPAESEALAGHLLGVPAERLPRPVCEALAAQSQRPGPIEWLVRLWVENKQLVRQGADWVLAPGAKLAVGAGLSEALAAQLAGVGVQAAALARVAAVLGVRGELPLLAAVAPLEEAAWHRALDALDAARLLTLDGTGYAFVRPAEAEALAMQVAPTEAQRLHGLAAEALTGAWLPGDAALPLERLVAIVRHRLAGLEPATGIAWAIVAARRLLQLNASELAQGLAEQALGVPEIPQPEVTALWLARADALRGRGRLDDALAVYDQGLLAALRDGQDTGLASALVGYGALLMQKVRYPEAARVLTEAMALADAGQQLDQSVRARLFLARIAIFSGGLGRLAPTWPRPYGWPAPPPARAVRWSTRCWAPRWPCTVTRWSVCPRARRRGPGPGGRSRGAHAQRRGPDARAGRPQPSGTLLSSLRRIAEAREAYASAREVCVRLGSANELTMADLNLGEADLALGNPTAAQGGSRPPWRPPASRGGASWRASPWRLRASPRSRPGGSRRVWQP